MKQHYTGYHTDRTNTINRMNREHAQHKARKLTALSELSGLITHDQAKLSENCYMRKKIGCKCTDVCEYQKIIDEYSKENTMTPTEQAANDLFVFGRAVIHTSNEGQKVLHPFTKEPTFTRSGGIRDNNNPQH